MRQRQQYQKTEGPESASSGNSVCLFNDYAVLDRGKMTFVLGNLIRMVLNGNHGRVDYKRPVNYNDSKKQFIICYFHVPLMLQGCNQPGSREPEHLLNEWPASLLLMKELQEQ